MTPLLQRSSVSASDVILTVKEEVTRSALFNQPVEIALPVSVNLTSGVSSTTQSSQKLSNTILSSSTGHNGCNLMSSHFGRGPSCGHCKPRGHLRLACGKRRNHSFERRLGCSEIEELRSEIQKLKLGVKRGGRGEKPSIVQEPPTKGAQSSLVPSESNFFYSASLGDCHANVADGFILDLGCTAHMVPIRVDLSLVSPNSMPVFLADGSLVVATSKGSFTAGFDDSVVHEVLRVPQLK